MSSLPSFRLASSPLFAHHTRARGTQPAYPPRFAVPDDHLSFAVAWPEYRPPEFTDEGTKHRSPEPEDPRAVSGLSERRSFHGRLQMNEEQRPLNPFGRTGLTGRGKLYYWGPNHAADCILTRPSRSSSDSGRPPQLLVIRRGDTGEWALVGGMIDEGEEAYHCAKREFGEEVLGISENAHEAKSDQFTKQRAVLDKLFSAHTDLSRRPVYSGYVDDARNTDNSWIETEAFHLELPSDVSDEELALFTGGSDAKEVRWIRAADGDEQFDHLYASHRPLVQSVLDKKQLNYR